VNKEMLEKTMPKASDDVLLLVCGPEPMQNTCESLFKEMGYNMDKAIII